MKQTGEIPFRLLARCGERATDRRKRLEVPRGQRAGLLVPHQVRPPAGGERVRFIQRIAKLKQLLTEFLFFHGGTAPSRDFLGSGPWNDEHAIPVRDDPVARLDKHPAALDWHVGIPGKQLVRVRGRMGAPGKNGQLEGFQAGQVAYHPVGDHPGYPSVNRSGCQHVAQNGTPAVAECVDYKHFTTAKGVYQAAVEARLGWRRDVLPSRQEP